MADVSATVMRDRPASVARRVLPAGAERDWSGLSLVEARRARRWSPEPAPSRIGERPVAADGSLVRGASRRFAGR